MCGHHRNSKRRGRWVFAGHGVATGGGGAAGEGVVVGYPDTTGIGSAARDEVVAGHDVATGSGSGHVVVARHRVGAGHEVASGHGTVAGHAAVAGRGVAAGHGMATAAGHEIVADYGDRPRDRRRRAAGSPDVPRSANPRARARGPGGRHLGRRLHPRRAPAAPASVPRLRPAGPLPRPPASGPGRARALAAGSQKLSAYLRSTWNTRRGHRREYTLRALGAHLRTGPQRRLDNSVSSSAKDSACFWVHVVEDLGVWRSREDETASVVSGASRPVKQKMGGHTF